MSHKKEAHARIKINKMLEDAGWRFFDDVTGKANISLEPNVKITQKDIDAPENDFEKTTNGYIDFLLLDKKGFPLAILEAKRENLNPLVGKEQARKYARSHNCRYIILSNGNLHYFWDLEHGNPDVITRFPSSDNLQSRNDYKPNLERLTKTSIKDDYITLSRMPHYQKDASWINEHERSDFIKKNGLKFLRDYQVKAVKKIQEEIANNKTRFLFEMATGTGKTLTSAAIINLFLESGNATRILFLVDRIELEQQAFEDFNTYLNHYTTYIFKDKREDWKKANILISTVQSLTRDNKYLQLFSPIDFELVISDEAHRSINGNARALLEYFTGYKLGLTATPKNYLKGSDFKEDNHHPESIQDIEKRILLDTYKTFGCDNGQATFSYTLKDGIKDGVLINPIVIDCRTDITTQMLSDKGLSIHYFDEQTQETIQNTFLMKDFERKYVSEETNKIFCKVFLDNAEKDPISGEIGKTIIFTVSQNHASKITHILNIFAMQMFPNRYQSDFAVQVTSHITDAQDFTTQFSSNRLNGTSHYLDDYKTSKSRVCVTVGMMTTGYDCPDILNLVMMRPIYSPSEFIQIKGRGTRKNLFEFKNLKHDKKHFRLFDFFGNCEYFEEKFNYDKKIELPKIASLDLSLINGETQNSQKNYYVNTDADSVNSYVETSIGLEGMKIDRKFFDKFEETVKNDDIIQSAITNEQWEKAEDYIIDNLLNKPTEFFTLEKLTKAIGIDRKVPLREILEKIFGRRDHIKNKQDLIREEFEKFITVEKPDSEHYDILERYFETYLNDKEFRFIIDNKAIDKLHLYSPFSTHDYQKIPKDFRDKVPNYYKYYIARNNPFD